MLLFHFPPLLCGAARQISLHQDLLCVLQSQRGGEHGSVSSLTGPFLCDACYFGLLWRILLLLRSEKAGYLPDSDCAEVITVLYWKEGMQERRWSLGVGERQLHSFCTLTSGTFTCSLLKLRATNFRVSQFFNCLCLD